MPKFSDVKTMPYTPEQMCDLVADVASYDQFLPWCVGTRIFNRKPQVNQFDADLLIGFKMFRERFTSRVKIVPGVSVDVDYLRGPLKDLYNHWKFKPDGEGGCIIDFEVDFSFKSATLEKLIGSQFEKATHKMMAAFEERARELYQ